MNSPYSISSLMALLRKPFPTTEDRSSSIKVLLGVSIFVTLFLYLLKPFDLDKAGGETLKIAFTFGCITFLSGLVYDLILRYVFRLKQEGEKYNLARWIITIVGLLLFISFFNFLYLFFIFGLPKSAFFNMIGATFIVGIFPTVFIGAISMLKSEKKNIEIANKLNTKVSSQTSNTTSSKTIFDIPTKDILYIESLQNYISIYYTKSTDLQKKTERATLKSCVAQIENTDLIKCHRSYIVNRSKIENVSGNAQGLKLKLVEVAFLVPVSRSYISKFKA